MNHLQGERDMKDRVANLKKPLRPKTHQEQARTNQRMRERDFALTRLRHSQRKTITQKETAQATLEGA